MTAQATTAGRKETLRQPKQHPLRLLAGLLSVRYFLLRASTATAAVVSGLVQTFVFARVLSAEEFSIYILIGTFGVSLWLFDLGAAKILFVRQRARHLAQRDDNTIAAQSSAVVALYALIVLASTLACFAVMASRQSFSTWQAFEFALFFSFAALNLVWFPLRNVSNAVDEFISFETLEAIRRGGHIMIMLALLIGMPLPAFLLLANLLWFVLLGICISRLVDKGAMAAGVPRLWSTLSTFWRDNRAELLRSGNYAIAELAIYNFPYLVVPVVFGLGAPTIILDTVFKIFRGATLIYAAGLDPMVPRQTRAFADHDAPTLKKATLIAIVLCAVPTLALCGLLLVAGDRLFALLLGQAATVPPAATLILVVLLLANLAQNVASCLLLHTGFFREIARVASFLVAAMAGMTALVLLSGLDIVGFMGGYAAVYVMGAVLYVVYVLRGPIRIASTPKVAPR
jgi:O-antigen/teichoic acid export membrane protein